MSGYETHYTAKFREHPPSSRSSSSCLRKSPAVPGHPAWMSRRGHRNGSSCAQSTSCPRFRFWTFLCRRWGTSWWRCSSPTISRFPSGVLGGATRGAAASSWLLGGERGECVFLVGTLTQRQAEQRPVEAGPGSIVTRHSTEAFRRISFPQFLARAARTWGIWCIVS